MQHIFLVVMSALLVVANMAFNLVSEGKLGYGENICYISSNLGLLLPLVTPVGVIVLPNLCFLSVTIRRISHTPKLKVANQPTEVMSVFTLKCRHLPGLVGSLGLYEGDSKSSRKSAAKFVIVMGNLRSLCML